MPYSILTYPGDGVTTTWPINFTLGFISRDDVKCRVGAEVDGLNQPVYRTLTWISDGLVEVQGTPAAIGQNVEFTRTVAKDALVHDYQDGAPITESNLDDSNKQLIMLLHEIIDDRLRVLPASNWDMNAKRIVNLGAGIDLTDAVTVQQAAQAIALTPTAVQAAADAQQALADAEDAKTDAEAAKNDAEAAASAAEALLADAMLKSQNLNDVANKDTARTNLDVYSKAEVVALDTAITTASVQKAGSTMTGALTLSANPTNNLHAATKQYVDERIFSPVGTSVYQTTGTALTQSTWSRLLFDTDEYDDSGWHSTVSNTGRITVDFTGRAQINCIVDFNTPGQAVFGIALYKNGSLLKRGLDANGQGGSTAVCYTSTWDVACSSGDYFEIFAYTNAPGLTTGTGANKTSFQVRRIK